MASPFKPRLLKTFSLLIAVLLLLYFATTGYHVVMFQAKENCRECVCSISSGTGIDDCVETKTNPKFNICLYRSDEDIHVSKSIRTNGHWSNDLTFKVHAALTLAPNISFIDIGANIGYFSLYACTLSKNVVAIEADRRNAKMIYKGLALNNCEGNIIVLNNAISNARTTVYMSENIDNNMGGLVVAMERSTSNDKTSRANQSGIAAITLDDLLPYVHFNHVVIKIDIEGYECKAMESSVQFFQAKTVHYMFMEWFIVGKRLREPNTACPLAAAENMVARLTAMGFVPAEYSPEQRLLDVNKVATWTAYDIVWYRRGHSPI